MIGYLDDFAFHYYLYFNEYHFIKYVFIQLAIFESLAWAITY